MASPRKPSFGKDAVRNVAGVGGGDPTPTPDPVDNPDPADNSAPNPAPNADPFPETVPDTYRIPSLTFGLEMEMCFAVRKHTTTNGSPKPNETSTINSANEVRIAEQADKHVKIKCHPQQKHFQQDQQKREADFESWEPKVADGLAWHLTKDDSVMPQRKDLVQALEITDRTEQKEYRVVGAELVSSVQDFDKMNNWYPKLEQLKEDLTFDATGDKGAWFMDVPGVETHLHVHFGIKDEEISLDVAKNVCMLYGLFENEIQDWLPVSQRESDWCWRLRKGMEREKLAYFEGGKDGPQLLPGKRYNPSEYADLIYACKGFEELKTITSGWSAGEWIGGPNEDDEPTDAPSRTVFKAYYHKGGIYERSWIAVNLSLKRQNKPFTIEFRQHHGTMDPGTIAWWVRFLGKLMRFAHYLAHHSIKIQHTGADKEGSFVDELPKQSILDLLGFPEEGRAHFHRMRDAHVNEVHRQKMVRQEEFIRLRIHRRKLGQKTGKKMDDDIRREDFGEPDPLPVSNCPGEEESTVYLKDQDLVNRIARITLDHECNGNADLGRERFLQAYNTRSNSLNYRTEDGFARLNAVVNTRCVGKLGLFIVWLDAIGMAKVFKYKRQRAEGEIDPHLDPWGVTSPRS
ncbi:uncharacterized protein PAC_08627 [Phialocephala subalpina]|uniref:Uncharacterized protein n=1 Tax=Phialocephala subalpina TaxID=576137 RepID=A0A1L7X140_9HELO|nr:uncharacterized protein PAC_08627 [Phialocephala subalpina]